MSCQMIRADDWDRVVRSARAHEAAAITDSRFCAVRSPSTSSVILTSRTPDELLALLIQTRAAERHIREYVQQIQHELAGR